MIVDYLTPQLARAAVESLRRSEVLYTAAIVDAHASEWSYSEAIHHGVRNGDAPIICALNADVECLSSQRPILDIFEEFPEVAAVGPLQTDLRGHVRHGGIFGTNEGPKHRWWGEPVEFCEAPGDRIEDAVTISGSVYYARRSVWEELGGFLDTPHYFEETWFSYLARHRGHRVVYTPLGAWLHHWDSTPVSTEQKGELFKVSQAIFRSACAREGIACD